MNISGIENEHHSPSCLSNLYKNTGFAAFMKNVALWKVGVHQIKGGNNGKPVM